MQLTRTEKQSVRSALTAACALLVGAPVGAHAEANMIDDWKIDAGVLFYNEAAAFNSSDMDEDRISVTESVIFAQGFIGEDEESLTFKIGHDAVTGASPTGATRVQTSTSASGLAPTAHFTTERLSAGATWDTPVSPGQRMNVTANYSAQHSYASSSAGIALSQDFNLRTTTVTAGLTYTHDILTPEVGIRTPLVNATTAQILDSSETKNQIDLNFALTQVISRTTLAEVSFTRSHATGYLTNPYKILSVVNPVTGETLNLDPVTESRPGERNSNTASAQINHHMGGVAYLTYMYLWDDWDMTSHVLELKYRTPRWHGVYLQPGARLYNQTAANLYYPYLVEGNLPQYASADHRLAKMQSYSIGIKSGYNLSKEQEVTMRMEYMLQSGENYPDNAIGVQRDAEFFPDLETWTFSIGYFVAF